MASDDVVALLTQAVNRLASALSSLHSDVDRLFPAEEPTPAEHKD